MKMTPRDRRNTVLNALGETLWGFQASLVASGTVLTILLYAFGADNKMIASVVTLETVLYIVPQIAGIYLFRSRKHRKRDLLLWHYAAIIPWLFAMAVVLRLAPGLPPAAVRWLLYGCWAGFVLFTGVALSVWMDWLASIFRVAIRGSAMGIAFGASALAGFAGALLSGKALQAFPGTGTYSLLYAGAGAIAVLSITAFFLLDDRSGEEEPAPPLGTRELFGHFGESLRDRHFRSFLFGRILAAAGFTMRPFITVYYMSAAGGGLSKGMVVSLSAAQALGSALANVALGRLGDRYGHRLGLLAGVAMQALTLALLLATAGAASCGLVFALTGISLSSGFVSHYNMMFESCPHGSRLAHITIGNLVFCAGAGLAPLLGGWAADAFGLRALFAASLAVSCLAFAWTLWAVREPRKGLERVA